MGASSRHPGDKPHLPASRPHPQNHQGFTLVEVLIALALLSLLMLGLTGAMRAMSDTSAGIERRIDAADRFRVTSNLLSAVLGNVSVRRLPGAGAGASANAGATPQTIFFEASPHSLAWIGIMPARFGVGGRHYLRLAQEDKHLVLRYSPWSGAATFSDWESANAQVVVESIEALDLRYLEPETLSWLQSWPPQDLRQGVLLPMAIEVTVHGIAPPWPPTVVTTYGLERGSASRTQGSWGPGS